MFAKDLHDLYKNLLDSISLPPKEVNEGAKRLIEAPENDLVSHRMRLQAILLHPTLSREVYALILETSSPEMLTSNENNVLYLLISHPAATVEDVKRLQLLADAAGNSEWFASTAKTTLESTEKNLNLSYNGQLMFSNEEERRNMMHTLNILNKVI